MANKITTLAAAVAQIPDGAVVAIGGNTLHRVPGAALAELVRQGKRGLQVVKTAGALDVDLLVGTGAAARVIAAYVGFETLGLAPQFRRAVEEGRVALWEHTCASVHAGLRAAIQGVSFMPMAGLLGSDLMRVSDFRTVRDPWTGQEWAAVPAIRPDWAILHVHEADPDGNCRIRGPKYDDLLMARAAAQVLVTAERIVAPEELAAEPERTDIPGFMVTAVVHAPGGAWPHSCAGLYPADEEFFAAYLAACQDPAAYRQFVQERLLAREVAP